MNTEITNALKATSDTAQYDNSAKRLLGNKYILAQILVYTVDEFKGMQPMDVVPLIEGEPKIGIVPVEPGLTNERQGDKIIGLNTENTEEKEGLIRFDIVFYARMRDGLTQIIINVEAQTKFKPGYPLTKRAIYYCSRMISAQHGPIFTKSEYGKIRKVYSIWICTQPSDGFENTLTRYSIKPEQLIGEAQEETENYDLMSVVMICLGKPGTENHKGILKFMEVLLSSTRSGSEKKKILEEEFGVAMSEELEREVLEVCNLSQGVRAEGREEGRQEGRIEGIGIGEIRMLVQLVREGDLPLERAAAKAKMTVEQFKETMENTPLQAV